MGRLMPIISGLFWGLIFVIGTAGAGAPPQLRAGLLAAAEELILIDRGHFGQCWDRAAAVLKAKQSREQWLDYLKKHRQPLGSLHYRKLIFSRLTDRLPGGEPGEYLVLRYQSSFAHRQLAFESLTLQRGSDGVWRLADYSLSK